MTIEAAINPPAPTLRLRIDQAALAHNWRALDDLSGKAAAGAAIKANCYGLGVDACIPALKQAGAARFFVAHWGEVAAAAAHIDPRSISVLHGPGTAAEAAYARATGAVPVINSLVQARRWRDSGGGPCDLMIDTGINRLGVSMSEVFDPILGQLDVEILMSHLSSADEDVASNAAQRTAFEAAARAIPSRSLSLSNSAGIALGRGYSYDLTRPGLALYGGVPRAELSDVIRQVAFPQAAIIQTRTLSAGDSVGYNAEFTATKSTRVAVVSLGYADGFLRCLGPDAFLTHGQVKLPLLGKVSMDMVVADLTGADAIQEGDWLEVPYDLPETSRRSGLSQYELLTGMGQRFAR